MTVPLTQPSWDVSRIDEVLEVSWEALDYQRFLTQAPERDSSDSYLFSEPRVRFEPWSEDVLVSAGEIALTERDDSVLLSSPVLSSPLTVPDVNREQAALVLQAIDGESTLAELRALRGLSRSALDRLLSVCFGILLFAPLSVAALEREVSGLELVRFPGAPYEIVRNYWLNMVAVRRALSRLDTELEGPEQTVLLLRRLHVLALMGDDLRTFYRPASPISRKSVHPGKLWHKASRTLDTPRGTIFLEGPRVNAALLGGEAYQRLVCQSAGDVEALSERRELEDEQGLSWGRLVKARAEDDERDGVWFCPPRPIRTAHWEALTSSLRTALVRARASDKDGTLGFIADFHQRFIRLHPFQAANQSVCMNIVGYVLSISHGAGLPHGILDHLALRLSPAAYRKVFRLAAQGSIVLGSPVERWRTLVERKKRFYDFVQRVSAAPEQAERLVAADRDTARLALISA
ncbi:MAG TPA: hypothetical protein VGP93_10335 [Polyangiaceae bacterium]|nr:hypothetical protein [Polyangiaceae bacterium]